MFAYIESLWQGGDSAHKRYNITFHPIPLSPCKHIPFSPCNVLILRYYDTPRSDAIGEAKRWCNLLSYVG